MSLLALAFFATALIYASVGFGGGSTYGALLALNGIDYQILPSLALICNIIVVTGGVWRFHRAGHLALKRTLPFIMTSIPFAFIGGRLPISEGLFVGLLGLSLLGAAVQMFFGTSIKQSESNKKNSAGINATVGAGLGFLSGMVGIGGGIFLAPILHFMRWGNAHTIAATCSFFILVNYRPMK